MNTERLTSLMDSLTNNTVLGELLEPVSNALGRVRGADVFNRVLNMEHIISLGVLRHLRGMETLREQVQSLLHLEPGISKRVPLPRSTWSDALGSSRRGAILKAAVSSLSAQARCEIPDWLAGL